MPWWTEARGTNEYPNESSRAAVWIGDDGEPVMGFSRRTRSSARVDGTAMGMSPWSAWSPLMVPCGGQGNIIQKG
jgi:hypothetical protein